MTNDVRSPADVITETIIAGQLASAVDEMKIVLKKTARSSRIGVRNHFACALLDADCNVVATDNPRYLAALGEAARVATKAFAFDLAVDDTLFTNDPYGGALSIHHLALIKPIALGQDIFGYVTCQAHMPDFGGMVLGNVDPEARELRTEAVRFTPMRLVRFGRMRRDIRDTLLMNSRNPEEFEGDLQAMVACLNVGTRAVERSIAKFGATALKRAVATRLTHAESSFRRILSVLPEKACEGESVLEQDGHGRTNLKIHVSLQRQGAQLRVDFSKTEPQSSAFVNVPSSVTKGAVLEQLLSLLESDIPLCQGLLAPISFVLPGGSLVNPTFPAPTGWSLEHAGMEVGEAVRRAMMDAVPSRSGPGYPSRSLVALIRRQIRTGYTIEQVGCTDLSVLAQPGAGATFGTDGWGQPGAEALGLAPSVEEFETGSDFSIQRMEFATDTSGSGQWRGATGVVTDILLPQGTGDCIYALPLNHVAGPLGFGGGLPGAAGSIVLHSADIADEVIEARTVARDLSPFTSVTIHAPGGGGIGNPMDRKRESVMNDLRDGYISEHTARTVYGLATS